MLKPRSITQCLYGCLAVLAVVAIPAMSPAGTSPLSAQPPSADSQTALSMETVLLSDLADGKLDQYSLLDAALILGGMQQAIELSHYRDKMSQHIVAACRAVMVHESTEQQLSTLLDYLHGEILTGLYVESCNDLRKAIDDGRYNCVTATILYCHLAQQCGLRVQPISLPGHVRVRSAMSGQAAGGQIVVEPTCPEWFQRGGHLETRADLDAKNQGRETGRTLSYVQLLAKLYYNRGLDLLRNGDHQAALAATELSWQLDPSHERARDNVATVMNNWALEMCDEHQYEAALQLLARGRRIAGDHPLLYANERHIQQRWLHQQSTPQADTQNQPTTADTTIHAHLPNPSFHLMP